MDLTQLLTPERILCQCQLQSKKRALQTLAEVLSRTLRADPDRVDSAVTAESNHQTGHRPIDSLASRFRINRNKASCDDENKVCLSEMSILDAFISRERLGSTGLGHGVALPHSRMPGIDAPIAALITLEQGVDYQSADGHPVDLVLGLLVPEQCNDQHLEILRNIAIHFSGADFRAHLRQANDATQLYDYLRSLASAA